MNNPFDGIDIAMNQARDQFRAVDQASNSMANMLVGRLRNVTWTNTLIALKKELRDLDGRTGEWRERK